MKDEEKSSAQQFQELADKYHDMEMCRVNDALTIRMLRRQVDALWDVAYECLPRGDAFYLVVEERTGKTRSQTEGYFCSQGQSICDIEKHPYEGEMMFTPGIQFFQEGSKRVVVLQVSSNMRNDMVRNSVTALQVTFPGLDILVVDDNGYVRLYSDLV